jgi:hypothetical protein
MTEEQKIWLSAKQQPIGLIVQVDNPPLAIQKLYQARKELSDPDLATFEIRRTAVATTIFIVRVNRNG